MKQKPADKFIGSDLQYFDRVVVSPVSVFKTDLIIIDGFYPVVGYGDSMSITAKILKDLLRPCKWTFGIGEPLDHKKRSNKIVKRFWLVVFCQLTRQRQFIVQMGFRKLPKILFLKLF